MARPPLPLRRRRPPTRSAVTRATLYAYASRGQVQSGAGRPADPKARRYHREDVERLRERKELRRDPARRGRARTCTGAVPCCLRASPSSGRTRCITAAATR